jgi:hypothetical protein
MAWYWWIGICLYCCVGSFIGGALFIQEGEDAKDFFWSLALIIIWPIFLIWAFCSEFGQPINDHFLSPVFRYVGIYWLKEKWQNWRDAKEEEKEFDKDERMGYKDV